VEGELAVQALASSVSVTPNNPVGLDGSRSSASDCYRTAVRLNFSGLIFGEPYCITISWHH
jgi:hypothetical protein